MRIKVVMVVAALAIPGIAAADDTRSGSGSTPPPAGSPASGTMTSIDKTKETAKLDAGDTQIVAHLNHVNLMEIDLGKLAQKQGTPKVKTYGAMLIKDHKAGNKQLAAFAKKHGVAKIPADMPATEEMQKEHQDAMDAMTRMKQLKGAEFDREFLTMMVTDHDKEIARLDQSMSAAVHPDLAPFLRTVKPVLQRHADNARELQRGTAQASAATTSPKSGMTHGTPSGTQGTSGTSGSPSNPKGTPTKKPVTTRPGGEAPGG